MIGAKPFDIPKREVWEAFKRVKANQGTAGVLRKNPDATRLNPVPSRPKPVLMSANTRAKAVAETPQKADEHSRTRRRYARRHDEKKTR